MIGSCFTENIGNKLIDLKFNTSVNSFGIIFNPKSIAVIIERIIDKTYFNDSDVFQHNDLWFCYDCHSSIYSNSKDELLNKLNHKIDELHLASKKWDYLFITFGTAYFYDLKSNQRTVANCHKLPQHLFEKKLAEIQELTILYAALVSKIQVKLPDLRIIFTVSPVKHLRDGIIENNLSKSTLLLLSNYLVKSFKNCHYFEAYELIIDDLRDYRFFEEDLAHPNQQAINYVWGKFCNTFLNEETVLLNQQLTSIINAYHHKILKPNSTEFEYFKKTMYQKCLEISNKHAYINLQKELTYFSN
jgi:hypothetical protein